MHERFMRLALKNALRADPFPNPRVGAVVVKNGRIVAEGFHERRGLPHAERIAIEKAGTEAEGATLYVTLEPCCHYGKTPPCADLILGSGIRRVVVASRDPNPLVRGKGVKILRQRGVEVVEGVLEKEAEAINAAYFSMIRMRRPWVAIKFASSIDGKTATGTGKSRWITSIESRRKAHELRAAYDAVAVGAGTVLKDNPQLTCRLVRGSNPVRVVFDSRLRTPPGAKVLDGKARTIILTTEKAPKKRAELIGKKAEVVAVRSENGMVSVRDAVRALRKMGVMSLLVEGGAALIGSFADEGIVDEAFAFFAPMIIGGREAKGIAEGKGVSSLSIRNIVQDLRGFLASFR